MPAGLPSTIRLFADDTIAYLAIQSNRDALTLQQDLDKLSNWETNWKMAFHPDKWGSGHYSDSPLLRRPIIPSAHFSDNPLFRQKWSKVV